MIKNIGMVLILAFSVSACGGVNSDTETPVIEAEVVTPPVDGGDVTPVAVGQTYTLTSKVFDGTRRVSVRVPAAYEASADRSFPVVYVIDGGPEQDFPHLAGMMQSFDLNWTVKPIILVGIETVNRRAEITPPANDARYDEAFEGRGGAAQFQRFIKEDVMTWVADRYRVSGDNMVIGESLAGLFVVDTFLNDPDLFSKYAAISPSLWWDDMSIVEQADQKISQFSDTQKGLYVTMGNEGFRMQKGLDILLEALESSAPESLKWSYVDRRNSEHHGSIYHPAAIDAFRTFYSNPERTGVSPKAFYMFDEGAAPVLSDAVKANLELECTEENAVVTTFEIINRDQKGWNGMCVMVKPGPIRTQGN